MKSIQIGPHRTRIQLQQPAQTETFDSFGQPIESFTTILSVFAKVMLMSGRELEAANQIKSQANLKVEFRWMGTSIPISSEWRILLPNNRYLGIVNINNIEERNRLYVCYAYEWQQGGPV